MLTQHEISVDEHMKWFERSSQDPTRKLFIFETNNIPVGFVHFSNVMPRSIADWGFFAAPSAKKGTGTLLGMTALEVAFEELGVHKVCGQALGFNVASIRLHRRLGFKQEGLLRDQHKIDAAYHDLLCFGLLHDEWLTRSQGELNAKA